MLLLWLCWMKLSICLGENHIEINTQKSIHSSAQSKERSKKDGTIMCSTKIWLVCRVGELYCNCGERRWKSKNLYWHQRFKSYSKRETFETHKVHRDDMQFMQMYLANWMSKTTSGMSNRNTQVTFSQPLTTQLAASTFNVCYFTWIPTMKYLRRKYSAGRNSRSLRIRRYLLWLLM